MILAWFGILILAFSWLKALHIYEPPSPSAWWIISGTAMIVLSLRNHAIWKKDIPNSSAVFIFAAATAGIIWLGGPFQAGFIILAGAAFLSMLPLFSGLKRWMLPGIWASGMILIIQAGLIPFLYMFSARYHKTADLPFIHDYLPGFPSIPWLSSLLYLPLKIINPDTAISGTTLYLHSNLDTLPLTPTWEKLGLFPLSLFAVGVMFLLFLQPRWRKHVWKFLGLAAAYSYIRLLALFLIVNHFRVSETFWAFDYLFFSFVPLALLFASQRLDLESDNAKSVLRHGGAGSGTGPETSTGNGESVYDRISSWFRGAANRAAGEFTAANHYKRMITGSVLLAGGLSLFWGFHDPGVKKQGRILIDERHSDWEWTTQPFDTTWYGGKSGYNYYCLADYWNHFYTVETRSDSITGECLSQWDVLVIKTPTSVFSPDEVDAIVRFVRDGGGLFLIGDHTNVFGTSTYLNMIAEKFGMYYRYDATYNLKDLNLNLYKRPHRFAHPVVKHMPNYLFATSCSLYSPLLSQNIILGYGLRAMYLDYSERSYFPTKENKMNYDFGLFVQTGGVKYGKGRVLGYTDSTCFSNFFMFIPGKPELALASIEWLNRSNRWPGMNLILFIAAFAGFIMLLREGCTNSGLPFWNTVIPAAALTAIIAGWMAGNFIDKTYPLPNPKRAITHVAFDAEHGNYTLPIERLTVSNWRDFQTFYVWTQRLGMVPRNDNSLEEAVRGSSILVEINPQKIFTINEIDSILDYVQKGGTLIVMDTPANTGGSANSLLGPFMMAFDNQKADSIVVLDGVGDTVCVAREAMGLHGSRPLLTLEDGRVTMGSVDFGRGKVVACGASFIFSSQVMGSTAAIPDATQNRIYKIEYSLLAETAKHSVHGRYRMND